MVLGIQGIGTAVVCPQELQQSGGSCCDHPSGPVGWATVAPDDYFSNSLQRKVRGQPLQDVHEQQASEGGPLLGDPAYVCEHVPYGKACTPHEAAVACQLDLGIGSPHRPTDDWPQW